MNGHEYTSGENTLIRGLHADIIFDNATDLAEQLENQLGFTSLYRSQPEELRYPVHTANLEYGRESSDDINLYANIEFDSAVVLHQRVGTWQKFLSKQLREILLDREDEVYRLKHQQHDFYVRLNQTYAAHVEFDTDTHSCHVSLRLERLGELFHASNGEIVIDPDPDDLFEAEHFETLRDFAGVWSLVIDKVTEDLGSMQQAEEENPKPQIRLGIPAPDHFKVEIPETAESFPAIEAYASQAEGFNTIGGLAHAKQRLLSIADTFKDPIAAKMYGIRPSHFVLHGPPGTGKTSLVRAFAAEVGGHIRTVNSSHIVDMWVGNSGKNIRSLFDAAKAQSENELIVLFFNEFEAIARKGHAGTSERDDVKKQFNIQLDDISKNHPNIIVAADTNADIADLEPSLVRSQRVEPIGAPLPNEEERIDVWGAVMLRSILDLKGGDDIDHFRKRQRKPAFNPYGNDFNLPELARLTDGMTGADFETILARARMYHFNLYRQTGEAGVVTQADLVREIRNFAH